MQISWTLTTCYISHLNTKKEFDIIATLAKTKSVASILQLVDFAHRLAQRSVMEVLTNSFCWGQNCPVVVAGDMGCVCSCRNAFATGGGGGGGATCPVMPS